MKTTWCIEPYLLDEGQAEVFTRIVESTGGCCIIGDYEIEGNTVYWNGHKLLLGESIYDVDPIFAYGSLQMAQDLQKKRIPIVTFANFSNYACRRYYNNLHEHIIQQKHIFLPFGEVARKRDSILEMLGEENQVFIRPDDGRKIFTGTVIDKSTWEEDLVRLAFYDVPDDEMCVLASIADIQDEYRFLVDSEKALSGSKYIEKGEVLEKPITVADGFVWDYVNEVLQSSNYCPDSLWTLDISVNQENRPTVLEVGCASCSGLYGIDLKIFVEAVNELLEKEWKNT